MKVHKIANPKTKAKLIEWLDNQKYASGDEPLGSPDLVTILKDVREDFILDRNNMHTVVVCEKFVFLIEMPVSAEEIFDYVENNPDKLAKRNMQFVMPVLKEFLGQMFDYSGAKYE